MNQDIKKYLTAFQEIQQIQINSIECEAEPDIRKMAFDRKRAFENLRNAISECSTKMLLQFTDHGKLILNNDKLLQDKLQTYKEKLSQKINKNARGKKLLKGYRGQANTIKRFMNTKG